MVAAILTINISTIPATTPPITMTAAGTMTVTALTITQITTLTSSPPLPPPIITGIMQFSWVRDYAPLATPLLPRMVLECLKLPALL